MAKTPARNAAKQAAPQEVAKPQATEDQIEETRDYPLTNLHLDGNNPRLGAEAGNFRNETEVLDAIVNVYGVDDVLSSMAVNGYFAAEPLVGVRIEKQPGHIRVAEGNRRLAACLILAGDERAKNQLQRTREYQALQKRYNKPPITVVPVRVHTDSDALLSYLGVRHIAASQPWDSYAKAAWIAKVMETSKLTLDDVTQMIGDQHGTVARSLEGFYFVDQLTKAAQFNPADSMRAGRGSNPKYPFSWVYTALGYGPVREWLDLPDLSVGESKTPIPNKPDKLKDAGELMTFLFGNKSKGRPSAITDSRQISDLAKAIANPESRKLLERGKRIDEVALLLKPAKERVIDGLLDAQEALQQVMMPLSQGEVKSAEAGDLFEPSKKVRSLATEVNNKIVELMKNEGA